MVFDTEGHFEKEHGPVLKYIYLGCFVCNTFECRLPWNTVVLEIGNYILKISFIFSY